MIARNNELAKSLVRALSGNPNVIVQNGLEPDLIKCISGFNNRRAVDVHSLFRGGVMRQGMWPADSMASVPYISRLLGISNVEAVILLVILNGEPSLKMGLIAIPSALFGENWETVIKFLKVLDLKAARQAFASAVVPFVDAQIVATKQDIQGTAAITGPKICKCVESAVELVSATIWCDLYPSGTSVLTLLILEMIRIGNISRFSKSLSIDAFNT